MKGSRIVWIDYAKAIGITLVILGHVPVPADIKWVIYGFHMPLFFVISGYLMSRHYDTRVGQLKKIANSLLLPYLIYASAITLMYCVIKRDMISVLLPNILTANFAKLVGEFTTICPLWFLISLATMKLFDMVFKNAPPQKWYKLLIITAVAIMVSFIKMPNYFMLKTTIVCVPFYYLGCCLKEHKSLDESSMLAKLPWWGVITVIAVFLACSKLNGKVNLTTCSLGTSYLFFLVSGTLGSIGLFEILRRLTHRSNKVIEVISEGTLLIMSVHYLMIKPMITLVPVSNVLYWLVDSFVILTMTFGLILFSKRYCPVLLGKKKFFK